MAQTDLHGLDKRLKEDLYIVPFIGHRALKARTMLVNLMGRGARNAGCLIVLQNL
jgi:hypothetical protein